MAVRVSNLSLITWRSIRGTAFIPMQDFNFAGDIDAIGDLKTPQTDNQ
jgi:hypothetical protein